MNKSNAEQQAKNIAKVCTKAKPNKNADEGHYRRYKYAQGKYAHDVNCPKDSRHGQFASEGHVMPTCVWCGHVSPKAPKNSDDRTVWHNEE